MPSKKIVYECKYCCKEYDSYEDCEECEKSHLRDFSEVDTQEIIAELRRLSEIASGYHIGYNVMNMPLGNFESLMEVTADRLEDSLNEHLTEEKNE